MLTQKIRNDTDRDCGKPQTNKNTDKKNGDFFVPPMLFLERLKG